MSSGYFLGHSVHSLQWGRGCSHGTLGKSISFAIHCCYVSTLTAHFTSFFWCRKGKEKKIRTNITYSRMLHICHPVNTNENRLIAYCFSCDSRTESLELVVTAFSFFKKSICCELENLVTIFGSHMPALWPHFSLFEDLCVFACPYMGRQPRESVWPELEAL